MQWLVTQLLNFIENISDTNFINWHRDDKFIARNRNDYLRGSVMQGALSKVVHRLILFYLTFAWYGSRNTICRQVRQKWLKRSDHKPRTELAVAEVVLLHGESCSQWRLRRLVSMYSSWWQYGTADMYNTTHRSESTNSQASYHQRLLVLMAPSVLRLEPRYHTALAMRMNSKWVGGFLMTHQHNQAIQWHSSWYTLENTGQKTN